MAATARPPGSCPYSVDYPDFPHDFETAGEEPTTIFCTQCGIVRLLKPVELPAEQTAEWESEAQRRRQ
jgi:hypothetical protein